MSEWLNNRMVSLRCGASTRNVSNGWMDGDQSVKPISELNLLYFRSAGCSMNGIVPFPSSTRLSLTSPLRSLKSNQFSL